MFKQLVQSFALAAVLLINQGAHAQKTTPKKYPSLFWEITGNGLKKPSYLFGTMHVSNKMVFHLSDSFYYAMQNVDAVALELNPDVWQGQMVRMDKMKQNYVSFLQSPGGEFLNENSFRIDKYEDELKSALNSEPAVVNNLLYRSYKAREDFEEDTFLDLYIFQTGKKLGKRSAGVEDFYETEKIVLEAYADMAMEKKKKTIDTDGESMRDISEKIQDAYRRGDLDLMDSLDLLTERSDAFREKFLYKRNEVQANSIDTIIKKSALFVGVGAAHLPGPRGVIEMLRQKGYTLRAIKMVNRDAEKKDATDKMKVPVKFSTIKADDGFYSVDMPGELFKMSDDYQKLDRRQYSDMSNGSYYLVTRVKTHAAFVGQDEKDVLKKLDSLLYENIPGKILKKTAIQKNGYSGYDISSRTRRGDLQRYNIFITPFEVILFKMSGKENYVDGDEANKFFSSIHLKETQKEAAVFSPKQGGFTVKFPQVPSEYLNAATGDDIGRWEYESVDKTTGDAYIILKKSVYNFKFLEEDSFDLSLAETSFRSAEYFDKQLSRQYNYMGGYPCLDVKEGLKDGGSITARFIIKGPHYFVIAARSKDRKKNFGEFINSFNFTPYKYDDAKKYTDTFLHFMVPTPLSPDLDEDYRARLEKLSEDVNTSKANAGNSSYWPKSRNALFKSDSTGELVGISVQQYPKYYYVKDSAKFWNGIIDDYYNQNDLVSYSKDSSVNDKGARSYNFTLRDTGSSRSIVRKLMVKDNYMFSMVTLTDTLNKPDSFIQSFFTGFTPEQKKLGPDVFVNRLDSFFNDLASKDSATRAKAEQSIPNVYYGEAGVPKLMAALAKIKPSDKNYTDIKTKFIAELGYIKDTTKPVVTDLLKKIYTQVGDTSSFQNEVMEALARHKTKSSILLFKQLALLDPPIFENRYDYNNLFNNLKDSLQLATLLYPEILQLTTLEDYKDPVTSLLVTLVDSGFITASQYNGYFPKISFDARIELKKQQQKDDKIEAARKKKEADDDEDNDYSLRLDRYSSDADALKDYAVLLMPFYDSNANVVKFFDKLLQSGDDGLKLHTAVLMTRNNKTVADSIFLKLAEKDQWRGALFSQLEEIKKENRFPAKYRNQLAMARSYLVADKNYSKIDSIVFISKQAASYSGKKGMVYFFKYRVKKDDDWKMGISGLQPTKATEVSSDDKLSVMTDKKLKEDKPYNEQFELQLKRLLYTFHKSAKNFYANDNSNYRFRKIGDYED